VQPAILDLAQVVVVDHEQVAARVERPAQARVRAEGALRSVVLQEAVEQQVGREVQPHLGADEGEVEVALLQAADVALGVDEQGHER
jgi:hypothetical protein